MNATATHPSPQVLTPEEIAEQEEEFAAARKSEEATLSLASDLLDRALHIEIDEAHVLLIQIADSGILGFNVSFHEAVRDLSHTAEKLIDRLQVAFPRSFRAPRPLYLREKKVITIEEQIDLLRQDIYWGTQGPSPVLDSAAMRRSATLIFELFGLYWDILQLRQRLDLARKDGAPLDRATPQIFTANRYQND